MTKKAAASPRKQAHQARHHRLRYFVMGLLAIVAVLAGVVFFVPQNKLPAPIKDISLVSAVYDAGEYLTMLWPRKPPMHPPLPKEQGYTSKDRQTLDHLIESETP